MQFRSVVDSLRPDVVFSVYVIWSHLLDAYPDQPRPFQAVVDTHDLLHLRQQEFMRHGQSHWIHVSHDEEAVALRKFDLILATQQEEANTLREMAPESDVVVVGHHPESGPLVPYGGPVSEQQERALRFGFIASDNAANVDGLGWFLTECWEDVRRMSGGELVIAGDVGEGLRRELPSDWPGVRYLGKVPRVEDFYAEIDIAINPVRFGSGIKIKSIEALSYGKPLIAHSHNTRGLSKSAVDATMIADLPDDFTNACVRMMKEDELRKEMTDRCASFRENELSQDAVYAGFLERLWTGETSGDHRAESFGAQRQPSEPADDAGSP
jgi:glycosyltransferase involved in cell wall biosynthesis